MVTQGLIFPIKELVDECELLKAYAHDVLDQSTVGVIDEVKGSLQAIQTQASTTAITRWQLPASRPLTTIWSDGESQPNKKSGHRVRATLSFLWDIRPLDEDRWTGRKYLVLDGRASTVVQVWQEVGGAPQCLARWTTEIGDHQSPGSHFHFQLNGFDHPPFPKSFDVPRLPGLLMTPFLAMELAIGELFQDRWRMHSTAETKHLNGWRNIHRPRLRKYFEWQTTTLAKSAASPWMALKLGKPAPDLLCDS